MLYLDYSRSLASGFPTVTGAREISTQLIFSKRLNEVVHLRFPGVLTIAKNPRRGPASRAQRISADSLQPEVEHGLDERHAELFFQRFRVPPLRTQQAHFSLLYAFSENYAAFSHDEVVHRKEFSFAQMPGDMWQQFANLRLLFAYQYAHPGKKLLFMGQERATPGMEQTRSLIGTCCNTIRTEASAAGRRISTSCWQTNPRCIRLISIGRVSNGLTQTTPTTASTLSFGAAGIPTTCYRHLNATPVVRYGTTSAFRVPGITKKSLTLTRPSYGGSNVGNLGRA